jgi:hypothetical protein
VPFGVLERGVGGAAIAGRVDQDHERDGESAEGVEGE